MLLFAYPGTKERCLTISRFQISAGKKLFICRRKRVWEDYDYEADRWAI